MNPRGFRPTTLGTLGTLFLLSLGALPSPRPLQAAPHTHQSPDGRLTAPCTCRPATERERLDPRFSPEGWVQDEPRESFHRGTVPLPLLPDWVGTRVRATGGLAWGDADHDGDLDLAVGTYYANMYPPIIDYYNFIYLNEGGVLEAEPSWIAADQKHTTDLEWADLNGDLLPDLFVANGGESLQPSQVFYGQNGLLPTAPGWTSSTSVWAIDAAVADFDRDDDLDVATANQGNSASPYRPTYLFINTGTGLLNAPSWQSAQIGITNSVDWGDMDGDGYPELAVAGWVNWQSGVFRNLGNTLETTFAWTTGHPERTDKGIGWSDVDGDDHVDLVVGGNGDPDWLFHNEGTMLGALPIWSSGESFFGCQQLAWVDIDRDQDEDLCTVHFSTGHVRIYLNNGGTLSTLADWQYDAASSGTAIAFGDVNDDGWVDLAVGVANGPIALFLNQGDPGVVPEGTTGFPLAGAIRIRAHPNPFADRLHLRLESGSRVRWESAELLDVSGRRVARIPLGATETSVAPSSAVVARSGTAAEKDLRSGTPPAADPPCESAAATGGLRRSVAAVWKGDGPARVPSGIYFVRATGIEEGGRRLTGSVRVVKAAP